MFAHMSEAVPARAAVLSAVERGSGDSGGGSWHITANGGCRTLLLLAVLPAGRRAPEFGRSLLFPPNSPEGRQAGLGNSQQVETEVPNWAAEVLFWACKENLSDYQVPAPMDVPVWVDPADGAVIEVARDALLEELTPYREAGVKLWKENESPFSSVRKVAGAPKFLARFGGSAVKEWKEALSDLKADMTSSRPMGIDRPNDTTHPPIEGIGYERWIYVKALLARDEVHPSHVDLYTHYRHIPWQRWPAIDAAWTQREAADPPLQAWADYDFRRMKPTGALWEQGY
jgi:hypothetical protein